MPRAGLGAGCTHVLSELGGQRLGPGRPGASWPPTAAATLSNVDILIQQILTVCLLGSWCLLFRVCTGWRQAGEEAGGPTWCKKGMAVQIQGAPRRAPRSLFGGQEKAPEDKGSKGSPQGPPGERQGWRAGPRAGTEGVGRARWWRAETVL